MNLNNKNYKPFSKSGEGSSLGETTISSSSLVGPSFSGTSQCVEVEAALGVDPDKSSLRNGWSVQDLEGGIGVKLKNKSVGSCPQETFHIPPRNDNSKLSNESVNNNPVEPLKVSRKKGCQVKKNSKRKAYKFFSNLQNKFKSPFVSNDQAALKSVQKTSETAGKPVAHCSRPTYDESDEIPASTGNPDIIESIHEYSEPSRNLEEFDLEASGEQINLANSEAGESVPRRRGKPALCRARCEGCLKDNCLKCYFCLNPYMK